MRKFNQFTLSATGLVALVSAAACSSPAEGDNDNPNNNVNPFGSSGQGGAGNGSAGTPGVVGAAAGSTGVTPGGGAGNEGQAGAGFVAGQGGSANAAGGAAGAAAVAVADQAPQVIPGSYFDFKTWRGYTWTYSDPATTRSVLDFAALPPGSPFCLSGSVAPDNIPPAYEGVASLGFNINQAPFGDVVGQEAPVLTTVPTGTGVAVNYTKTAGTLRIQLQSPAGETDENQRWCADLTEVQGPEFIPYEQFRTRCWLLPADPAFATSVAYQRQPISAVVLTVPGDDIDPVPYNVCVAGFADGTGPADAPTSGSLPAGLLTGTMSGEAAKQKVVGKDGRDYIVNNNAWGVNSRDGTQQIRYAGNSFEILQQSAGPGGDVQTFPSIYIGAHGAQTGVNGATTAGDNPLPIQVSAINSLPTTFNHSGPLGDNNATYDVWFAPNPPQGEYQTAQAAFLMVWTHKPGGRVPIGNPNGRTGITVAGVPGTWDLWVGPRGGGGPDANLPVLSYVAPQTIRNFSFDLDRFITDAVSRNLGLTNQMFLTDVFAGFEIWSGGAGLRVDEFTAVVNP